MTLTANAVIFADAGRLEMRQVTLREPGPDEVVVATNYSSISSGTERLLFEGKLPGMPHLRYPLIPGYEAAGTVIAIGADVKNVAVGDSVFVGGSMCYSDVAAAFGGQSSCLIKRAEQVVPLKSIPLSQAPLLALAATALHGVLRLGDVTGQRVAVLGMGALGRSRRSSCALPARTRSSSTGPRRDSTYPSAMKRSTSRSARSKKRYPSRSTM